MTHACCGSHITSHRPGCPTITPLDTPRIAATIWNGAAPGRDEEYDPRRPWSIQIDQDDWCSEIDDEWPQFPTLQDAYDHLEGWAYGRGVTLGVTFGYLLGSSSAIKKRHP